ncbi:MAG: glycine cleavage system protein H, partial [Planctomycetales bacterium]|nr:glycine cleavage system protein H [Planctomycetales bacterium]NIP84131.1 glycine cleavage system protein H [Planctomycetales bacterium]
MSPPLVFMMGEFAAPIPIDRRYARNHMWAQPVEPFVAGGDPPSPAGPPGQRWRFGFAAYAVRLLQDVYFLDWNLDPDTDLEEGQEMGAIES